MSNEHITVVRKKIVSPPQIQALSVITVNIFLPCLIVAKTLIRFHPEQFTNWWILPLSGFFIILIGLVFSSLLFRLNPLKKPLMTLASMQNAGYLILPVGLALFPEQFDRFAQGRPDAGQVRGVVQRGEVRERVDGRVHIGGRGVCENGPAGSLYVCFGHLIEQ